MGPSSAAQKPDRSVNYLTAFFRNADEHQGTEILRATRGHRMKPLYFATLAGACACALAALLIAIPHPPVKAEQAPVKGCVAVVKQEYDSAKKQMLLQMRYSSYTMTGGLGRRSYWYCRS
jgi:hypothetical protein